MQASNVNSDDSFGRDVAIGNGSYIMGMLFDDTLEGINTGSVVLNRIEPPTPDLTGDAIVDGADLGLLLSAWSGARVGGADLNLDGVINGADLGLLLSQWGPTP